MNIFVIHSGADYDTANRIIAELKKKAYSLNALMLKNGSCFWMVDKTKNPTEKSGGFILSKKVVCGKAPSNEGEPRALPRQRIC